MMESSVRKYREPGLQVIGGPDCSPAGAQQYRRAEMRNFRDGQPEGNGNRQNCGRPVGESLPADVRSRRREASGGQRRPVGGSLPADVQNRRREASGGRGNGQGRPAGERERQNYGRSGRGSRKAPGRQQGKAQSRMTERERRRRRERLRRERARRARRRRIVFVLWQIILLSGIVLLFKNIKSGFDKDATPFPDANHAAAQGQDAAAGTGEADRPSLWQRLTQGWSGSGEQTYPEFCGLDEVDAPVKREPEEVLDRLEELGREDERIAEICANRQDYPDNMLEALANNPEMADFVAGYPAASGEASGGFTETEQSQEHPLFLQWDPRWGYVPYGDNSNIGLAGCGPVSLSMALYYLTGDVSLTPDVLAAYAMENGYYMAGTGTAWALMTDVPGNYGVRVTQPGVEESRLRRELDAGHVLICAMREGDFTASGHFIVIYGYDQDGFLVNDPNCVARSRRSWSYDQIRWQIKQLWSLGKEENADAAGSGRLTEAAFGLSGEPPA